MISTARNMVIAITVAIASTLALPLPAAASQDPGPFLNDLWRDAQGRGVRREIFNEAFRGYRLLPEVEKSYNSQPEVRQGVGAYVSKRVEPRVDKGQAKLDELSAILRTVERQYGVPAELLVSIWGIETNFGNTLGGNNVIHALATLSQRGKRTEYFRKELLTALTILEQGHIRSKDMIGSWAGAMGQTQFMPSSYMTFAQDFDGDGRKDIWRSLPDALASTANYLKRNGWRRGEAWGYEVSLPRGFDNVSTQPRTLAEWKKLGIQRVAGTRFPRPKDMATLYLPAGKDGPAFLLLRNFKAIKRYNNSDSYALAVGHLADRIAGGPAFATPWPREEELGREQRIELQRRLAELSYDIGEFNGILGPKTRAAVADLQANLGLPADGIPDGKFLSLLGLEL